MKRARRRVFFPIIIFIICFRIPAEGNGPALIGAAVQLRISGELLQSEDVFFEKMENVIARAKAANQIDLIVFPEYTSAFLALVPHSAHIENSGTVREALSGISSENARIENLRDIFTVNSVRFRETLQQRWGELARKHGVYIMPGTYFHYISNRESGNYGKLVNRALLFGPHGRIIYRQDKVFLTDFETKHLDLAPGDVHEAKIVEIRGVKVALTICKDTYHDVWESKFSGAHVWINIKADAIDSGFTTFESAMHGLPGRVTNSAVSNGLTVCLTGSLLEHHWGGRSYFFANRSGKLELRAIAGTDGGEDVVIFTVSR